MRLCAMLYKIRQFLEILSELLYSIVTQIKKDAWFFQAPFYYPAVVAVKNQLGYINPCSAAILLIFPLAATAGFQNQPFGSQHCA